MESDKKRIFEDFVNSFQLDSVEVDVVIELPKSPNHISMIRLCPKTRKRKKPTNYVVFHLLLKHLQIPSKNRENMDEDLRLLTRNIIALEVIPLLKSVLKHLKKHYHIKKYRSCEMKK